MVAFTHGRIVEDGTEVRRADGATIFSEGDSTSTVYAVVEGAVRIEISTESGQRLVIAQKVTGDIVGELGAIDGQRRSASAIADGDVLLAAMSQAAFIDLLRAESGAAIEVMRQMSTQLRTAIERTAARNAVDVTQRLARRLLDLVRDVPSDSPTGDVIDLRLTQDDLAGWIGASREATSRALAKLRAEGIVATARRQVTILDRARLNDKARLNEEAR